MNCKKFNSILYDLAQGEGDRTRVALQSHAEECADCAAQLAAQEKLVGGLQSLRVATLDTCAPAKLEARLLESFRRQSCVAVRSETVYASEHTPAQASERINSASRLSSVATIWNEASRFVASRRFAFLPAAAVAIVLIAVVSLAIIARRESGAPGQSEISSVTRSGDSITTSNAADNFSPGDPRPKNFGDGETLPVRFHQAGQPARGVRPRFVKERRHARPAAPHIAETVVAGTPAEVATEFLPLVEAESLAAMDGGHVVRVEMPRQALLSMGLPMNNDRAHESVKADVLMGDDGLARAIRFVR